MAGLHGSALAFGSLVSALVVTSLVRRYGRMGVMWAGMVVMCLGIAMYTASLALPVTLLGMLVGGFGGTFVVVSSGPVLADRHGLSGPAAISEGNAVAAGVGTLAPLIVGACVGVGLGWRPAMLLLVPVVVALAVSARRVRAPRPAATPHGVDRGGRLPPRFWLSWGVLSAGIAVEYCFTLWSADVLRERMALAPGPSAAGVTALVAGMCTGRVAGGRLALRFSVDHLLYAAISTTLLGFTGFWLAQSPLLGLPALVVCGLGIALFYPIGIARLIEASEGRPDRASARAGIGAALAAGAGPFVLGAVADLVGLHLALLVVPTLLASAAVGVRLSQRRPVAVSAVPPTMRA